MHIHTIQLNIEKMLGGCAGMDATEFGAYLSLIITCYQTNNLLPDDDNRLARMARVTPRVWKRIRPIISIKFTIIDGKWSHDVIREELQKYALLSTKNKANALKRNNSQKPVASQSHSQTAANTSNNNQVTKNKEVSKTPLPPIEKTKPKIFVMPDGKNETKESLFERYWKLYPNLRSKGSKAQAKKQLFKKLSEGKNYEEIGKGIAKFKRYSENSGEWQPDMCRWIKDNGWENEYGTGKIENGTCLGRGASGKGDPMDAVKIALEDQSRRVIGDGSDFFHDAMLDTDNL